MEELRIFCLSYLEYHPKSGLLFWKKQHGAAGVGSIAGCYSGGRSSIRIQKKLYAMASIIWLMVHGRYPDYCVDHIDHDPLNNRIDNLRLATQRENLTNMSLKKNNTSGVCGVSFDRSRGYWMAGIKVNGKRLSLGRHKSFERAAEARREGEVFYGFHPNHGAVRA